MSGPIQYAIDAIKAAQGAMRGHGLVTEEECRVCFRRVNEGGVHTPDCAYRNLGHAIRRLVDFQTQVAQ